MSKNTYLIFDDIGMLGRQLAGDKNRAISLWAKRYGHKESGLKAYEWANEVLPVGFEPYDETTTR